MILNNTIVDISNVTHVIRHSMFKKNEPVEKNLLIGAVIGMVITTSKRYSVDGILVAGDSKNVWRKDLYNDYKGQRKQLRDEYHEVVLEAIQDLKIFFNEYTNVPYIDVARSEADDIIAVACQKNKHGNVIISSDKDFIQLLDGKTKLFSPTNNGERTSDNVGLDLFIKCIRGDIGDNIKSAYPRVRTKVLEKAFEEPMDMINLMEHKLKTGEKVKDLFELNQNLIDLTKQPSDIRESILQELSNINSNNYNHISVLKYFGELGLNSQAKELDFNMLKKTYVFDHKN